MESPHKNKLRVDKTEVQTYMDHRREVFEYLDVRKTRLNSSRITTQEILENTSTEKSWEAVNIYKEWLRKLGQEKINAKSSTKKAQKATETKLQEESNSEKSLRTESSEEESKTTTTSDPDGTGDSTESNDG